MIGFRVGALIGAALVLSGWGYGQWRAHEARAATVRTYEQALAKQQAEAARVLGAEQGRVRELQRTLADAAKRIKEQDHERQKTSAEYEKRLAAAVAAGGGWLRDPHATGCGAGGAGAPGAAAARAGGGAAGAAQAGGLVSAPLTELLLELTREADRINDAYAACRADALVLRERLSPSAP